MPRLCLLLLVWLVFPDAASAAEHVRRVLGADGRLHVTITAPGPAGFERAPEQAARPRTGFAVPRPPPVRQPDAPAEPAPPPAVKPPPPPPAKRASAPVKRAQPAKPAAPPKPPPAVEAAPELELERGR
jgi:hypothetical protein